MGHPKEKYPFRDNDRSVEGQQLGVPGSNSLMPNLDMCTFPDKVSEVFLSNLRNVELLKTCRLVCTSWNDAASRSLRICSVVILREDDPGLTDFTALLLRRSFGPLRHLQPPFKNFHAVGRKFTDPVFIKLVLQPNVRITRLMLFRSFRTVVVHSELDRVLAANKGSITDLIIPEGIDRMVFGHPSLSVDEIDLTALKHLLFHDDCSQCEHIPFMKSVLRTCNPESIHLVIRQGELVVDLLPQHRVRNLKHLALTFREFPTEAWEHISKLKFSKLTSLYFKLGVTAQDFTSWLKFFPNVSPFVEDLSTDIPISSAPELWFPKLRTLNVDNNTALSAFTPDKFPSLSKVVYKIVYRLLHLPIPVAPHHGVHSFAVRIYREMDEDFGHHDVLVLMTYVSRQFPSVSSLEFCITEFGNNTLADVCECFPKLTTLSLEGKCDFFAFSGMSDALVTEYLELGYAVEGIPRRKSITDFMELQFITLDSRFVMHPDMLIHCLPRVPNLKHIEFHWNEFLSASLLRDSIGHLEKIGILNSSESEFKVAMAEVMEMLPNVYLKTSEVLNILNYYI